MWEVEWWHWAALGFSLLVLDLLLLNVFYLLWFGAGALGVAAALAYSPETPLWGQIVLFALSSALLLALWIVVLRPRTSAKVLQTAREELPGMSGVVVKFNPQDKRGTIRLQRPVGGRDVWDFAAESADVGDRATIEGVDEKGVVKLGSR